MTTRIKTVLLIGVASGAVATSIPTFAQASPSAFTSGTRYDKMHRVVGTIAPDPDGAGPLLYAAVRNTYDAAGRLIRVEKGELSSWQSESVDPSAWTGFTVLQTIDTTYDALDRKVKETLSGGTPSTVQTLSQVNYDSVGLLQCTAVRMDPAQWNGQSDACVPQTTGPNGPDRITKNLYDAVGQLIQVREGVGTSVEATQATYSYTANGKRQDVIDGNGNRAKFVYDGLDRVSQWQFPSATAPTGFNDSTPANALATAGSVNTADYQQYGYDADDNRTSLRKRDGQTISYSYDNLDRMSLKDLPGTAADVSYSYDARGHQVTATFTSSGQGLTNTYDGFGELASATTNLGGTSRSLSYQYDADSNRTRITHPDTNYFTYSYDGVDRLNGILEGSSTSLTTVSYDQLGRRLNLGRTGAGSTAYGYDNAGRLNSLAIDLAGTTNDQSLTFASNPASDIASRTSSNDAYSWTEHGSGTVATAPNGLNQIATKAGTSFGYDANGNLTSDGATTFAYDSENRLTSGSGAKNATLAYDPAGRLSEVTSSGTSTNLVYDGDSLVAEYDGSGSLLRRYVHSSDADEPLVEYEGSSLATRRFLFADQQESVLAVTDTNGNALNINRYDEYGVPQSTNAGRFQYTGQQWLPELGISYYKARMYRPSEGVFMQTDPVGYQGGLNLYDYVLDDPVVKTDPLGEQQEMLLFEDSNVSKNAAYRSNDPNAGIRAAAKMNLGIAEAVAVVAGAGETLTVRGIAGTSREVLQAATAGALVNGGAAAISGKPARPEAERGAMVAVATALAPGSLKSRAARALATANASAAATKATGGSNVEAGVSGLVSGVVDFATQDPRLSGAAGENAASFVRGLTLDSIKESISSAADKGEKAVCKTLGKNRC